MTENLLKAMLNPEYTHIYKWLRAVICDKMILIQERLPSQAKPRQLAHAQKTLLQQFKFEPHHEKTCLRGFRPVKTQTGLLS